MFSTLEFLVLFPDITFEPSILGVIFFPAFSSPLRIILHSFKGQVYADMLQNRTWSV